MTCCALYRGRNAPRFVGAISSTCIVAVTLPYSGWRGDSLLLELQPRASRASGACSNSHAWQLTDHVSSVANPKLGRSVQHGPTGPPVLGNPYSLFFSGRSTNSAPIPWVSWNS